MSTAMVALPEAGYYCRPNLTMQRSLDSSIHVKGSVSVAKIAAKNIVIEADDLLRIRAKINLMYADRKVIVAPCLCKLYMSRQSSIIDSDGKTSPDWFLFDSGVIALVYDVGYMDFTIALFDKVSVRLSWCLKWSPSLTLTKPNANFHVLNTKPDSSAHVGILYENKNVADLILNAMELLFKEMSKRSSVSPNVIIDCGCGSKEDQEEDKSTPCRKNSKGRKKSILRSLSLKYRRSFKEREVKIVDDERENVTELSGEPKTKIFRKLSLRQIGRRVTVDNTPTTFESAPLSRKSLHRQLSRSHSSVSSLGADQSSDMLQNTTDFKENPSLVRVRKNAFVFDSLANRTYCDKKDRQGLRNSLVAAQCDINPDKNDESSTKCDDDVTANCDSNLDNISEEQAEESGASRLRQILFQRRRISRTQSLRIESQSKSSLESSDSSPSEKSLYQRPVKLLKPRSGTDSLLLHGRTVKCVINTGHAARYAREKRHWMNKLHKGDVESTDLCVTEL